jgi:hypothetical protein
MRTGNQATVGVRADYVYGTWGATRVTHALANTNVYLGAGFTYSGSQYVERQRTRVAIDPNVRVRGDDTYAGFEDVTGPIAVGEVVDVYEPESGAVGEGKVTEIDGDKELVYLSVDWSSLSVDDSSEPSPATPSTQLLFIAEGPVPRIPVESDWLRLISRPCLADIGWGNRTFWVTAPVATAWSDSIVLPSEWCSQMEIRQLKVSPGSSRGVAA